jgi:hypothetical protein
LVKGVTCDNNRDPRATHVWRIKTRLPERKGQTCRVLARGKLNSCLVEFADGTRVVTSRWAVRKTVG